MKLFNTCPIYVHRSSSEVSGSDHLSQMLQQLTKLLHQIIIVISSQSYWQHLYTLLEEK